MEDIKASKTLLVIVGPTAVGKTSLALDLAKHFGAEIISADSRQIFRELSIGTAKPTTEELAIIKHHFIDSHSITDAYDAAQFGDDALQCIKNLFQLHNVVVMCGGSGLYIKAVLEGFDDIPTIPQSIRDSIIEKYEKYGIQWLQGKMRELDPEYFCKIDQQNPHRLIRALEVIEGTGHSISFFQTKEKRAHSFSVLKIGLELPRDILYERIDKRMDAMIAHGLVEEAKQLYAFKDHNALQTVGYQEVFDFMDNAYDENEMVRLLKRNTRRYAKRQLTWFKRDPEIQWFRGDEPLKVFEWISNQIKSTRSV